MDPRKLKRLLDTYREAGVSEVELSDALQPTRIRFGAAPIPVPTGEVDVPDDWNADAPMDLARTVERIRKQYEPKPTRKGRAS